LQYPIDQSEAARILSKENDTIWTIVGFDDDGYCQKIRYAMFAFRGFGCMLSNFGGCLVILVLVLFSIIGESGWSNPWLLQSTQEQQC
jgi:hypothetical protein